MKSSVFITTTKYNNENNLLDAVKARFDQFGGVNKFVKKNVFIKINVMALET